jgi:hypothetical protein
MSGMMQKAQERHGHVQRPAVDLRRIYSMMWDHDVQWTKSLEAELLCEDAREESGYANADFAAHLFGWSGGSGNGAR